LEDEEFAQRSLQKSKINNRHSSINLRLDLSRKIIFGLALRSGGGGSSAMGGRLSGGFRVA
jgi:hypothetical protein